MNCVIIRVPSRVSSESAGVVAERHPVRLTVPSLIVGAPGVAVVDLNGLNWHNLLLLAFGYLLVPQFLLFTLPITYFFGSMPAVCPPGRFIPQAH
jgi:hypothetical protein